MAGKTKKPKLAEIVPAFRVQDVKAAIAYYQKRLGFKKEFHWPPKGKTTYAGVSRDGVDIHLSAYDHGPSTGSHAMIFMNGVDAFYAECLKRKANICEEIGDREYGMRDFGVQDEDGNRIFFGQGL